MKLNKIAFIAIMGALTVAAPGPGFAQTNPDIPATPPTQSPPNPAPEAAPAPGTVMLAPNETLSATIPQRPTANETAFERVMRTGVLRCGYYIFAPMAMHDPKSSALTGLAVDMMEHIGAAGGLQVQWTQEVDYGDWTAGLQAGSFDALCTPSWPDMGLARYATFTRPVFYAGINVYARSDDARFDNNFAAANNPGVTIAVIDGAPQVVLAQIYFPRARLLRLLPGSAASLQADQVVTRRADLLLWDEDGAGEYMKAVTSGLHNIAPGHPLRVMPYEFAVGQGDYRLRDLLDTGVQSLQDSGFTDQILDKWERVPGQFLRVSKPYAVPTIATSKAAVAAPAETPSGTPYVGTVP